MTENSTASQQPLVSVLTPVYNGERYLSECIESVLNQTYQNWEYIIVNNCSTDRTLEIATEYAGRDQRIRIVNNSEFVSSNRNHNIALMLISPVSKYCKFVQADDLIFPTCLSEMVQLGETHPSVGIINSYQLRGCWVWCDGIPYPNPVIPGREVCRAFLLGKDGLGRLGGNISAFLLRADIVRSRTPFLNEKHLFNDTELYFLLLQNYDYGFVHQVLSYNRVHEERLSTFAERNNQWSFAVVYFHKTYGPVYLNPKEHKRRLQEVLDRYYRIQGHELFYLREKSFWQYHRRVMKELGLPLSYFRLLKGALLVAGSIFLAPFKSLIRPFRYIRSGQSHMQPPQEPKRVSPFPIS